ncbi:hypothetical protein HAX54_026952, partial [Datura stramonium]|nr:hypothetical protein [Datura stramonium]
GHIFAAVYPLQRSKYRYDGSNVNFPICYGGTPTVTAELRPSPQSRCSGILLLQ